MKIAAALGIPILVFAAPYLFTEQCLASYDFVVYHEARATLARETFQATGQLPRWDPRVYAGTPFAGNFEMGMAYPPNRLFLLMPPIVAWEIYATLHLLLAAWGMYRLTRAFHLRGAACLTAAIAYGLSFAAIGRICAGHVSVISAYAWLPWLAYAIVRLTGRPTVAATLLLSIVCAALFTSGLPQFVYLAGLMAAAIVLWRARSRGAWAGLVGGAGLGLLLAATHLLPALDLVPETTRGVTADVYGGQAPPPQHVLLPENFASAIIPHFPWEARAKWLMFRDLWHEKALYIGLLPLMAAALSLFAWKRGGVKFFAVAALVSIVAALPHVSKVLSTLPMYGSFRVPARIVMLAVMSLAVLSAFGVDAILRGEVSRRKLGAGLLVLIGLIGGAAIYLKLQHEVKYEAIVLVGLAGISALVLLRLPKLAWVVAAADLCFYGILVQPRVAPERYAPAPWYEPYIGAERAEGRIFDHTQTFDTSPTRNGFRLLTAYGYPIPQSNATLYAKAWDAYAGAKADTLGFGTRLTDWEVMRDLNVRWYVTRYGPLNPEWRAIAGDGDRTLYEDPRARPYASFEGGGAVGVARPVPHRIELSFEAGSARRLIVSETWMKGWRAEVDGKSASVGPIRDALMAVDVPAGASSVVLEYEPRTRTAGRLGTLAGVLMAATLAGLAAAQRRNRIGKS